jgi:hypothetical protein
MGIQTHSCEQTMQDRCDVLAPAADRRAWKDGGVKSRPILSQVESGNLSHLEPGKVSQA